MRRSVALTALALLALPASLSAQIVLSANDGKQVRPGEDPSTRTADSVSVIDLRSYPPRVLGQVAAPASMIGPPASVAVARDGGFALVTAAQSLSADGKVEPATTVSVIDLADPAHPAVVQTAQAGPGASGVAINPAGTLAMVASTGDDSVTVFAVQGKRLTSVGKVQLAAKARPTDVAFAPDGATGLIVAQGAGRLIPFTISGTDVKVTGEGFAPGVQPYGVSFSADGRFAYNTNLGGNPDPAGATPAKGPRMGTITAVNLASGAVTPVEVGYTPEHVTISADGRYLAAVVHNGSGGAPGSPGYNPNGSLQVYRVAGTKLTKVADAPSGAWCQGALFSTDARTLLLQCAVARQIEVYRFDGKSLKRDEAATIRTDGRPGALGTALTR